MTGIIFSPAAQTDIEKIWDYTATSWNVDQAERYIQDIRDA
ncbi:type II toxin-antitoxin system RelE/ParE family toxin, partial [Rhizobium ruizarguesonis]